MVSGVVMERLVRNVHVMHAERTDRILKPLLCFVERPDQQGGAKSGPYYGPKIVTESVKAHIASSHFPSHFLVRNMYLILGPFFRSGNKNIYNTGNL